MMVFVAGATGAIGRPLVPKLLEAGHEVTGMTRSQERATALREAGAEAVVLDVFDMEGVRAAMAAAAPEVVVHQLTALPHALNLRDESTYEATSRLRTEGTRILIEAARAAGSRRMVAQSISFLYAPEGSWVKDEEAPVIDSAGTFATAARAAVELERMVTGAESLEGLALRYGFFYGPGTYYAPNGSTAVEVRGRRLPLVDGGHGVFSFVHVDDAAEATVAAVERGLPGVYNIVDDEPAPMCEWLPVYADALGARAPLRVPKLLARAVAGPEAVSFATAMRGASNAKAKRELGWKPRHPSWRDGFSQALS